MNSTIGAAAIFSFSYIALLAFKRKKSQILWSGIGLAIVLGLISARDIVADINWNVMGIFVGTLLLAEFFILSGVPNVVAGYLISRSSNVGIAFLYVCIFSSVLSAFIENVATVLIIAPVAFELARKIKASPVPVIIGVAVASNLQGTATLIGDPPSMILANYQNMNFNDFIFYHGEPGIFFAVEAGAVASMAVLYLFFRRFTAPVPSRRGERVKSYLPSFLLAAMIGALALSSLVDPQFRWFGGASCMVLAAVCFASARFASGREKLSLLRLYDWHTTAFLAGVFVMVGMLERTGVIAAVARTLGDHLGTNQTLAFLVIVWASVAFSAFVDNVPYVTAMIPVVQLLSRDMGASTELLVFGLLIGACLGGNITPVGASANVVAAGLLRKSGNTVSLGRFVSIGLPFTVAATAAGSLVLYLIWG